MKSNISASIVQIYRMVADNHKISVHYITRLGVYNMKISSLYRGGLSFSISLIPVKWSHELQTKK
jgi:hypothetical protein